MANLEDMDFIKGMQTMLGIDEDKVNDLIERLDADTMTTLADAVANNNKAMVKQIVASIDTDEDVNPLFRGDNIDDKVRKKKHRRKVAANYQFNHGDDVHVRIIDPKTGRAHYEDGTVYLPDGPDDTIGVKIQGKSKMVDRTKVRSLEESALDEAVLGMMGIPGLERMQQLAGIQLAAPAPAEEIAVQSSEPDPCSAAQQAMEALEVVAAMLPNVRLADLKTIRQRIVALQSAMSESR
jgi:hypothetical protein